MVSRDQVLWGYRLLLEREPESEAVVADKAKCSSVGALVEEFLGSSEFRDKHPNFTVQENRWVMIEHVLGFRIWVNLADLAVSGAVMRNQFEPAEVAFVHQNVCDGDTVLDIGTNIGFFSLLFSKQVGTAGRVIGFEPLTFLYEAALKSIEENLFKQCSIHNVALAAERGSAQLIYAPGSTTWGGAFLSFDGVGLPNHASVAVSMAPLSDFVENISARFIKIDVEGAEHVVLSASQDYLAQSRPVVMSEIHEAQLKRVSGVSAVEYIGMMGRLGYRCFEIGLQGEIGREITGNEGFGLINVVFTH
jgi:FkbM family methyltransferase